MYKIYIDDRTYTTWKCFNIIDMKEINNSFINPIKNKLFTSDVFSIDNINETIKIEHSTTRITKNIPGVLILNTSKTYGRTKGNTGMLLYKVIPDDKRIPIFLVPYEIKHIGFSKVFTNIYVTFNFCKWDGKHPVGYLNQVIGSVNILVNFYEYQLYCKSLNASIQKFTKDANNILKNSSHDDFIQDIVNKYSTIEDRCNENYYIFTIDHQKCCDYDDAFSVRYNEIDNTYIINIYITNVTIWLDILNLWDSFSMRISTIYLPDKKRPMLPSVLTDCLCSLQENNKRIALSMDILIDSKGMIQDISYKNCMIKVNNNLWYEDKLLLKNKNYIRLLEVTQLLSSNYKYLNNVRNSNDVVSYLMILMNHNCAKELLKHNNGIFRSTTINEIKKTDIPDTIPNEVCKIIKLWNTSGGKYINANILNDNKKIQGHDLLNMDAYVHITSPIRRLVDLLNIIKLQDNNNIITLSKNALNFYNKWTCYDNLEYINVTMRNIRKVQNACSLLELYVNNPEKMELIYEGYMFDKITRNDGLYQYIVYLPELKLTSNITLRTNYENYYKCNYKLYLFNDEDNLKKKIKIQML